MKFQTAFMCILFISKLSLVVLHDIDRKLFQTDNTKSITISTADEFIDALENKDDKITTIKISKNSNIQLIKPIGILTNNTKITGELMNDDKKPKIKCKDENGYIIISGNNTEISNIEIEDCISGPVIRIESNEEIEYKIINLSNLDFKHNNETEAKSDFSGGALYIGKRNSITITNSTFKDNYAEQGAGIYWQLPSKLKIENSKFENNIAEIAGGALYTSPDSQEESNLEIENCIFKNNQYNTFYQSNSQGCTDTYSVPIESIEIYEFSSFCPTKGGGALFLEDINQVNINQSSFESNFGAVAAGAIFLRNILDTYISSCNFTSNKLILTETDGISSYGGAIYVLNGESSSFFYIEHSSFIQNTAAHGGAIHFLAIKGNNYGIEDTDFNENNASISGGAIIIRNKHIDIHGNRFRDNKAFTGGAVMLANDASSRFDYGLTENSKLRYNIFIGNTASDGGAIAAIGSSSIRLIDCFLMGNAAGGSGGAFYILGTSHSGNIELVNVTFDQNIALKGGAIYSQSGNYIEIKQNCTFSNNKAIAGGAVYISVINSYKDTIKLDFTSFINNLVKTSHKDLVFPIEVQDYLNSNTLTIIEDGIQGSDILLSKYTDDPCYPGGGGAICLQIYFTQDSAKLDIQLSNLNFTNNFGYVGGAIIIITKNENTNICTRNICQNYINMFNSEFYGNVANGAGGAIFAFSPEHIQDNNTGYSLIEKDRISLKFGNNSVIDGGYGKDIATGIANLKSIETNLELFNNLNSNDDEIELKIGIYDYYDQHIAKAVEYSEQVINVRSLNSSGIGSGLSGTMDVTAIKGICDFKLKYDAAPGIYPLEFKFDNNGQNYIVNITIRDCYIGEQRVKGTECLICAEDFYSFNPENPCFPCPKNAICEGSQFLFPNLNYWHSSPFSPLMHRCLYKKACDFENRLSDLRKIRNKNVNFTYINYDVFPNYTNIQCNEGYRGVLCASCAKGYTHKKSGECIKCEKSLRTAFIIVLYFSWTLLLLSATVKSALTTVKDINILEDLAEEKKLRRSKSKISHLDSISKLTSRPSIGTSELQKENEDITILVDYNKIGTIKENEVYPSEITEKVNFDQDISNESIPDEIFSTGSINRRSDRKINKAKIEKIISAEKLSEVIKIIVNFLKVTSIAIFVNIKWTQTLERVLLMQESLSGITGSSSLSPVECYISEDPQERVYSGTVFQIFYPLIISAFLTALFFVYWIYHKIKHQRPFSHFVTRLVVVIVVTLFFAYDSITSYLLRIINCVKLDTEDNFYENSSMGIENFEMFSVANQTYWVEDPEFICFEGRHAILVYSLGLLGLTLFTFGVPFSLTITLLYLKYKNRLQEREIINKIGFVYQGYIDQFSYWEVIILIRKALVHIVVIFAYPLKENLQCVMLLGIMVVALILHILAWPYEYLILNLLEMASLLVSFLTFYFGLIFNDERSSDDAILALSFLLLFIIVSLYITFIVCLVYIVNNLMNAFIQMTDKEVPCNFFRKIALFINITLSSTLETGNEKLANIAAIFKQTLSPVTNVSYHENDKNDTGIPVQLTDNSN